jgi:hypothetical protein
MDEAREELKFAQQLTLGISVASRRMSSNIPDRAKSAAAAGSQPDYGEFFLNERCSDVTVVIKEELATEDEIADENKGPPCKRPRVSSDSGDHVRCALLNVRSRSGTCIKLVLSTSPCGSTKQHTTRLPGHQMVLWGRSGFFRSKVRSTFPRSTFPC